MLLMFRKLAVLKLFLLLSWNPYNETERKREGTNKCKRKMLLCSFVNIFQLQDLWK